MTVRRNFSRLIAGTVLILGSVSVEGQTAQPNQEQTHFSAEDEGAKHPVPLPSEVLAILRRDAFVKDELEGDDIAPERLPTAWFSASEITLGGRGEKDLIVVAEGLLRGANVDTFWVFVHRDQGYALVLTVPAFDIIVKSSRTNGYRNIEASAATAVTVTTASFRFDGHRYVRASVKTEDIK